ncbi:hypothetical protein chiPu_0004675 [Chiloscyllium punctatum]|uniref:Uncharacterized protein n=1 Tax=Chiloscyllium punctatum TaxID=137246 RepID=A0A401S7E2_CHIPU|nr:hypothetical protein [Chiloscyllium punctatum]
MEPFAIIAVSLLLGALIYFISAAVTGSRKSLPQEGSIVEEDSKVSNGVSDKNTASKKQKLQRLRKEKLQQHVFSHPLLATSLKDCIPLAFITWLANEETIRVFKMIKKDDGTFTFTAAPEDFPKKHKAPIVNIGIAETGKFIMSASNDTTILIWDLKGEVLATINTNQMNNAYATVSPCGRFVASCGFTPDVKVWEVCFTKSGSFREVMRAFDLKGHSAGIYSFAFSNDSTRMATISKDGTWKLWDTDVQYKQQQDPYLLYTMKYEVSDPCRIALSPDARVVAISSGFNITVHNAKMGKQEEEILNVHGEEITGLAFDVNSRFLVSCGDRAIRVFHNVVGYRAVIEEMEVRLKKATNEAMRERVQQQISDAQKALEAVCIRKE